MRQIIYTIELTYEDGRTGVPVFIATHNKENLLELINKNKIWWERDGKISKWKIVNENYNVFNLPEEEYENIIATCDVVDEIL